MEHAAHGPSPTLIKDLLVFLIAAGILVPAMRWLKMPTIIAFMLAGVGLGPYALGHFAEDYPVLTFFSITEPEAALPLAELGVLFLLFLLGVEFSFQRLWALRKVVLGAGGMQTLLSAAVIAVAGWALGLDPAVSLILGLALALSSTAIVMQVLVEEKRAAQPVGRTSLGVLLFQDIMVAPILIFVGFVGLKSDANLGGVLLDALIRGLIAIAVIWVIGNFLLGRVFRLAAASGGRDFLMALTLLTVVGAAAITYSAGLSVALGAFLAGLLVGETEFKHQTEVDLEPFKGLLLGLFFMTVGMSLDLPAIAGQLGPILAVLAGLIVAKVGIAYLACRLFAGGHPISIEAALLLAPAGEFAFIILTAAQAGNAVTREVATFAAAVAGLSMLLTPLLGQLGRKLAARRPAKVDPEGMQLTDPSEMENHVVLAGYGRVGRAVARVLKDEEVSILAIDRDPEKVHQARLDGLTAYVGDAARPEILTLTGIAKAEQFIVTVDDPNRARDMVSSARSLHRDILILARAHDGEHAAELEKAGAAHVVPEAVESGLQMAGMALEGFGYETETVRDILAVVRDEEYRRA
ncbi:glutathione-regulated potassium-efflux system protein [Hyphomonas neptunium ATCC 15444]|uniref:Glutathione-regulated potassium-efflux system protein n=2 Tax=Hyphomonas TaxID=85 RepID=Q0BYI9_HYPNA|nr:MULTISPECIES: cation:proton antiporter [Hyphomonas]ABI78579.1 glutathione-regulated potassium-efflux system protein [Hyphomonas neptunium ATCC 15444]KCZ87074.1 glutathione-regulated potassium-efflux system protein [Hyphomonas hirschiana VP5]